VKGVLSSRLLPEERNSPRVVHDGVWVLHNGLRELLGGAEEGLEERDGLFEAENGCRLAAAMSAGMEGAFACNMDSTVGGTSDGFSDMMIRWWAAMVGASQPQPLLSRKSERDTEVVL